MGLFQIIQRDFFKDHCHSRGCKKIIVVGNTPQWFNSLPKYLVFNAISVQDIKRIQGLFKPFESKLFQMN